MKATPAAWSGADLQAYLAAGVTSDHELTSADDALEKLRAGLTIEIRGSHPYLLPDIVAALKTLPHLSSQITVCTDDVPPDILLEKGGIIALLNLLIEHGFTGGRCAAIRHPQRRYSPAAPRSRADCRRAARRSGGV
ncbi:putative amidohydrolase [Klebsiella pneumoniae subsp. rhinoscleromatis]|nr:putative amidohydrolase [Klebsiella pneumoniae subsp. rhinoscleromatis]